MPASFPSPRLTAICLIVAACVLQIGYFVTPWEDEATLASYHEALAANPTRAEISATLLHFGWLIFVPAIFGIIALLRPRGGRLLAIGGVLAVIGVPGMSGLIVVDFYDLAIAQELPGPAGVALGEKASESAWQALFVLPSVFGALVGMVLLVFALWRADLAPRWAPFAVLVGHVITFALPAGLLGFGIGGSITAVGLIAVGLSLLRLGARHDLRETPNPLPADATLPQQT